MHIVTHDLQAMVTVLLKSADTQSQGFDQVSIASKLKKHGVMEFHD